MDVSVQIGWWILPLVATAISFLGAFAKMESAKGIGWNFYSIIIASAINTFFFGAALIVSLVCWLIYALAT